MTWRRKYAPRWGPLMLDAVTLLIRAYRKANPADLHAAIAQLEAQHGGRNWRALCEELVNAPDAVAFWAAVGHIRQAVNAQAATEAS